MACCIAITLNSTYAQLSEEKNHDFLKKYKAPDFKLKRFDIFLNMYGGELANNSSEKKVAFYENVRLYYSQYSNMKKYQGSFKTTLSSEISLSKEPMIESFSSSVYLSFRTENRFYFKPKWFFGVYGDVSASHYYHNATGQDRDLYVSVGFSPTVAIGYGRLEPIQYARNAMDIERQLTKGKRLNIPYSLSQLTEIADELAVINNVRFYDFRLRRIEQFEAIDQVLRKIGGVNEFDMAYFAHLSDAYLYAQNFQRFSGFRNELGFINATNLNNNISDNINNGRVNTAYYYNVSYNLPASYALQHTFMGTAIFGANTYDVLNSLEATIFGKGAWFMGGYELGLFPTTRTNFNFGTRVGINLMSEGFVGDVYANGSVYLSPQFRISFEANFTPEDNYFEHPFRSIPNLSTSNSEYSIGGGIRLNYAIF